MKSFKSSSSRKKCEHAIMLALYPVVLIYEHALRSAKFLSTRKYKLIAGLLTICLMLSVIPAIGLTAFAAPTAIVFEDGDSIDTSLVISQDTTVTVKGTVAVKNTIDIDGGAVTFVDGTSDNTGRLVRDSSLDSYDPMIDINNGTVVFDSITIDGNNVSCNEPAIKVNGGSLTINDGTVVENHINVDKYSAAIWVKTGASLTMNGGIIQNNICGETGNTSNYGGAGIYNRGTTVINGGTIKDNMALGSLYGGGIYNTSKATLTVKGGTISGNTAASGVGNGIFHSSQNSGGSQLNIYGDAVISDEIYLDNTSTTKFLNIMSELQSSLKLRIDDPSEGRVVAEGSGGYVLTYSDMSLLNSMNVGFEYFSLDEINNQIKSTATPTYYLGYNANGGQDAPEGEIVVSGNNTVSALKPTYTNYEFVSWNTKADGSGTAYLPSATIPVTENTTLYAQWKVSHTHGDVSFLTEWHGAKDATEISQDANIVLYGDTSFSGDVTIAENVNVTLCLNGYTISLGEKSIKVNAGATLTVCDCKENGKITAAGYYVIQNKGTLNILGGLLENTVATREYRSVVSNGGTCYMSGGKLKIGRNKYAALYNGSGSVACYVSGGVIESGDYAISGYGDIYLSGSPTLTSSIDWEIYAMEFSGSKAEIYATATDDPNSAKYTGKMLNVYVSYNGYTSPGDIIVYNCTDTSKFRYNHWEYGLEAKSGNLVLVEILFSVGGKKIYANEGVIADLFGDGGKVSYTPATSTSNAVIKLNGATIDGGVFATRGDNYTLEFTGENSIYDLGNHFWTETTICGLDDNAVLNMEMIYTDSGDIVIEGKGKINIVSEYSPIYVGDLTISGCEITAICNGDDYAIGAEILTINEGMKALYATINGDYETAILAESVIINGDKFEIKGSADGNAPLLSEAVYNPDYDSWQGTFVMGSDATGTTPAKTVRIGTHAHNWASEWESDSGSHWHKCIENGCDITDYAQAAESGYGAHTPDEDDGDCTTDVKCSVCDKITTEAKAAHTLINVPQKEATKDSDGNVEYWYCEDCGKYFADQEGKTEITKAETVVKYSDVPPTGDTSNLWLWVAVLLVSSVMALGTMSIKKRRNII